MVFVKSLRGECAGPHTRHAGVVFLKLKSCQLPAWSLHLTLVNWRSAPLLGLDATAFGCDHNSHLQPIPCRQQAGVPHKYTQCTLTCPSTRMGSWTPGSTFAQRTSWVACCREQVAAANTLGFGQASAVNSGHAPCRPPACTPSCSLRFANVHRATKARGLRCQSLHERCNTPISDQACGRATCQLTGWQLSGSGPGRHTVCSKGGGS
jgi:hypothetical protein